jgi:hypothetical protein
VEQYVNDPIKKKVIDAIKNGSWINKFCYDSLLGDALFCDFSFEEGFTYEDFYANETFVMFAKYATLEDWKKFLNVRLDAHKKAYVGRTEYYDMMKRGGAIYSSPLYVEDIHLYYTYYILRSGVVEYLIAYCDIEKVKEFVSREEVLECKDLQVVIRSGFERLFMPSLLSGCFGGFFDFWIDLVKDGYIKNPKLCRETEKVFAEKYPEEFTIYQKLFRESL